MSTRVTVGVDGGGTKTHCSVIDIETEKLLGVGTSGCSNQNSVGKEKAKEAVEEAIKAALADAKRNMNDVSGVCLGMSGVDRPDDKKQVTQWIQQIFAGNNNLDSLLKNGLLIHNDGVTAIASGTWGILTNSMVVISGTGSICIGSTNGDNFARTGGWGPKLGDTGNAWSIGNKILGAVARAVDGVGPETKLVELVKNKLNLKEMSELIPYIYQDHQWSRVAEFAPLATECYETDNVAKEIITSEVESLFNLVKGAAKKLGWNPNEQKFTLVLCGSVLTHKGSIVAEQLMDKVKKEFHHVEVTFPKCEPSLGAALLAAHHLKK